MQKLDNLFVVHGGNIASQRISFQLCGMYTSHDVEVLNFQSSLNLFLLPKPEFTAILFAWGQHPSAEI